jgi:Na+-transporting NADH:ubiquinone oxidoreductase subunit NqrB
MNGSIARHESVGAWRARHLGCLTEDARRPSPRGRLQGGPAAGFLRDARLFQIAFLATLLTIGVLARDFALLPQQNGAGVRCGTRYASCGSALKIEHRGVLSALITCFGLSILLRADSLWVHPLAAALAISAKFVLRIHGKHLLQPREPRRDPGDFLFPARGFRRDNGDRTWRSPDGS